MTSATSALAAAKISELMLVVTKCRLRMTASKLPRPNCAASFTGPGMVRLPWIRNRNGGSTNAARMTMRRIASAACWRAESRAQRPVRASVAAMSRTCARSADVVKDGVLPDGPYGRLLQVMARPGAIRHAAAGGEPGIDIAGVL